MPESLKKIGIVLGTREGKLIARLKKDVPISTKVYSRDGRQIGKVVRIFGPVKEPYAAIDGKGDSAMEIYVR